MATDASPGPVGGTAGVATVILALSGWLADPAVLTAVASLITALAAFWRARHRVMPQPKVETTPEIPPFEPHDTLHEAEARIRQQLFHQIENLQEQVEQIRGTATRSQERAAVLERAVMRCPATRCRVREIF